MVKPVIIYEGPYEGYTLIRVVHTDVDRFIVERKGKDALGEPDWKEACLLSGRLNDTTFATFILCKVIEKDCNE